MRALTLTRRQFLLNELYRLGEGVEPVIAQSPVATRSWKELSRSKIVDVVIH
jgi:hypothetical protein